MATSAMQTYSVSRLDPSSAPEDVREIAIALKASVTLAKGTVLGELTASPGVYAAYNNSNTDGTQTAKCILKYGVTVDASNNITIAGEYNQTQKTVAAYVKGRFKSADLTGLDAAGLTDLAGSIIQGDLTTGEIRI